MAVKISIRNNIDPQMLRDEALQANEILAIQVKKDTEQFVPALTESLSNRTRVKEGFIIYPGPYARYLYGGKLMIYAPTGSSFAPKGGTKTLTNKNLVFQKSMHSQAQDHWFEASKALNKDKWMRVYGKALKRNG